MAPASLTTMGRSSAIVRSAGISMPDTLRPAGGGTSPTYMVPNRPLGMAWSPWAWAWYMPIAGSVTVKR